MAVINGTPGDDLSLIGGAGDDQINGDDGHDRLTGAGGDDLLEGGSGDDELDGGDGDDRLRGGSGRDLLIGGAHTDYLDGGSGDDRLDGGDGQDLISGGSGSDVLLGGAGTDHLAGGDDNDFYLVDEVGDIIEETAGGGHDEVYALASSYTLLANFETLVLLTPGSTGIGNDQDNILIGTTGADRLDGRAGADTMLGGDGNDLYFSDSMGDRVVENAGEGLDHIGSSVDVFELPANVEDLTLLGLATIGIGNASANAITGNEFNNILVGLGGNDVLAGRHGDDNYSVDSIGDLVQEVANQGGDTVYAYGAAEGYVLPANVENLVLLDDPTIGLVSAGSGNELANRLQGNRLANDLNGGGGNDWLEGFLGNDTLRGGAGADRLVGGDGEDRLIGGVDQDALFGGAGADRFALTRSLVDNDFDQVFDFTKGTDFFEVDRAQFGNIASVQEGVTFFRGFAAAANTTGPVFVTDRTQIYFDPDGRAGPLGLEFLMFVPTMTPLTITASDFVVV